MTYPRDLIGYGRNPPDPKWPGGARLALSIVVNYEEGGERNILHGDTESETFLQEVVGIPASVGGRNLTVESMYEYGTRVGFWRLLRMFAERDVTVSFYAVAQALERHPEAAKAMVDAGHEVLSHGYRWIDYQYVPEAVERDHLKRAVEALTRLTGSRPLGWYTGRVSENTRRLVVEEGGFLYDSDAYNDDLPYWVVESGKAHLVIPYSMDSNDMKTAMAGGFGTGQDWLDYVRDAFDLLYAESAAQPRMMSVGLHLRLIGRPGRALALARFLDHVKKHPDVWICRRVDIARHWIATHPYEPR